jgi:hypothetical protein
MFWVVAGLKDARPPLTVPAVYHFRVTGEWPGGPSSYYCAKWTQGTLGGVMDYQCFVLHIYNLCVSYLLSLLLTVSVSELVPERVERSSPRLIGTVIDIQVRGELYMYWHISYRIL